MQIYISYRQKQPAKSIVRNWLCPSLKQADIDYCIDEEDCGYGHNIEQFEREIGDADSVLVMLSEQYFYSINCMYELALVVKNRRHRIFYCCIKLFSKRTFCNNKKCNGKLYRFNNWLKSRIKGK